MKRATITMDEYGRVAVPSDAASVWMSEMELVKFFDVIAPTLHQAAQWLLCGCVCLAYGRGTRFPYQYAKCRKGTQYPAQKAVLAKRKTNAVAFVRQQYSV